MAETGNPERERDQQAELEAAQRRVELDELLPPEWPHRGPDGEVASFLATLATLILREQAEKAGPGNRGPIPAHLLPLLSLDASLLAIDAAREVVGALDRAADEPSFNRIAGGVGAAACRRRRRLLQRGGPAPGLADLAALLRGRRRTWRSKDRDRDLGRLAAFEDLGPDSRAWKQLGDLLLHLAEEAGIARIDRPAARKRLVSLDPAFSRALEAEPDPAVRDLLGRPTDLPMLCPPIPWQGVRRGGWLLAAEEPADSSARHPLVKHQRHRHRIALLDEQAAAGGLQPVLEAVNALQATRWRLDRTVLEAQRLLLADGGPGFPGVAGAREIEELRRLVQAPGQGRCPPSREEQMDEACARYLALRTRRDQAVRSVSLASRLRARMDEAGAEAFHLPMQVDFRGRVYAQPALTPQDRDSVRALFRFAEGLPLDEEGERWLAVHLANRHGGLPRHDGRRPSREERAAWTAAHETRIRQLAAIRAADGSLDPAAAEILAADHPIGRWWREARQPWQFLAACLEWAARDQPGFRSTLPIILDGTANGLQHISALCRDPVGAAAVNLVPDPASPGPRDCYEEIAAAARGRIAREQGTFEIDGKTVHADNLRPWLPHLDRGLVKAIAMTLPYGSTAWTTRATVEAVLDGLPEEARRGFPSRRLAASQLNRLVRAVAVETVPASRDLLDWLRGVAGALAAAGLGVEWTAPSGFPVLVEHLVTGKPGESQTETELANGSVVYGSWVDPDRPPTRIRTGKQLSGVAAHLVHSLDAAHLVAVVNRLAGSGVLAVLTVHDAFGVHAAHVGLLQDTLRQEFHRLHARPLLEEFIDTQVSRVEGLLADPAIARKGGRLPNGLPARPRRLERAAARLRQLRSEMPAADEPFDLALILEAGHLFD